LADPSGGPVLARSTTVLPCPTVPSGSLSGLHLPSFSTNLRVAICTCTWTGHHLATFTRRPGSSLYTMTTEPAQVATSGQVSASGQVAAPYSCRLLSHQTLLWHHRLGHPPCLAFVACTPASLSLVFPGLCPRLPPLPTPPCLPCVEGRQRTAPHSSSFPPTTAPLQTLHMDVKGEVPDVLISWIRAVHLELRERFREDLPVLCLHSDRGGEFSSDLLREFCRGEGILHLFMLPASSQKNGVAERRIGLVMEVAHTSMIHAAASHFLWPFAVRYAAHQLNLWPRVSLPETSPTLRWTGKVGDASVFRVCGSCAFVRDTFANKLSARAIPWVFLGLPPDAPGWQFYHPASRRVLPSRDVTFDDSVPFCYPLPPQGPAPSGMSQVDRLPVAEPVEVTVDSGAVGGGAARGAASGGDEPASAKRGGAERVSAEPGGAMPEGAEPGDAETEGAEPGGAESEGAESGGAEHRVTAGARGTGGARVAAPRGARTRGTGAAGSGGVGGAGAGDPGA
ncbi:unnamed protein product, partial [Closterium sp. NIES-53]